MLSIARRPISLHAEVDPPVALPHPARIAPRALAAGPCLPAAGVAARTGIPAAIALQVAISRFRYARDGQRAVLSPRGRAASDDR